MAYIEAVSTALPPGRFSSEEVLAAAKRWLEDSSQATELYERFSGSSRIFFRHFVMHPGKIIALASQAERAEIFQREGGRLAVAATGAALAACGAQAVDVGCVVSSSCTAPLIPSIDTAVVNSLGLSPNVFRVPMYQHGCVGGAVGLAAAKELASSFQRTAVLAVELCSLGFHREDLRADQLVGSALFADGAACAIINRDAGALKILDTQTVLIPETEYVMGYNIHDNGAHLRLDKDLPGVVVDCARKSLPRFLEENGLRISDIATWLFHPGGVKILNLLEAAFGIAPGQTRASWEVLNKYGNMSSASVLFVLDEYLRDATAKPGEHALMIGIGPGLTVQYLLFSRVTPSGS